MALPVKYTQVFFAPDLDPSWDTNPGLLIDVTDLIPSKRGTLKSYASTSSQDYTGFGFFTETSYGITLGGACIKRTDGTGRLIVGTTTRLMECTGTSWVDVSAGGTNYSTATDWDFATFGNHLIAVSKANAPHVSTAVAAAFTALAGAPPKASCITVSKNFVMLGDCNNGVNDLGDQVWWSALGDETSWTASAATQAGNLRLLDTAGKVCALVNMRDGVAAYKEDSLYVLDYQGSPLLWTSRLISDKVGCAAPNGVAVSDGLHYFLHRTGVYRFDGSSVQNMGRSVNRYLCKKTNSQVNYATVQAAYEEYEGVIFWFFYDSDAGSSSNQRRYALTFHPGTGQFGFIKNALTSETCRGTVRGTLADFSSWNSAMSGITSNLMTVGLSTSSAVRLRQPLFATTGGGGTISLTTGDIGDETSMSTLTRVKPRTPVANSTCQAATVYGKASESDAYDSGTSFVQDATRKRWDGLKSERFLKLTLNFYSYVELAAVALTMRQSGTE